VVLPSPVYFEGIHLKIGFNDLYESASIT
jgi:hypothetical protein